MAPASDGVLSNTIRPPLVPVACFGLGAPSFDFDSSFLVPAMRDELARLSRMRKRFEGFPLSLFGHADPTGDDEYNKMLSGRRAKSVFALLVRRADIWEQLYSAGTTGDRWARRHLDLILSALVAPSSNAPYLSHVPTDATTSSAATRRFQADNGLAVDGIAGPDTRHELFAKYMAFLGNDELLHIEPSEFLGGGAGDSPKAAMQGCGEFNAAMVLGAEESATFSRDERDEENAVNRRVVIYFFDKGTAIDPARWPCPTVDEKSAGCKKRFWPDGNSRRSPTGDRRTFDETQDTFACRFYQRIAGISPCERPTSSPLTVDILFDVPRTLADVDQAYTLASTDGVFAQTLSRGASIRIDVATITLRFTGVRRGKTYSLFLDVGDAPTIPIFTSVPLDDIEEFGTLTPAPEARVVLVPPTKPSPPQPVTKHPRLLASTSSQSEENR